MALTMAEVARDYETDGVPSSGPHKIKKSNMRNWGAWVEGLISAFTANGGLIFASKASLDASLNYAANSMAWVIGDATVANNGVYGKVGGSGSGSWSRRADLPFSFIIASDAGAGTANAIQATTSIPVSGSALIWMNIFEANTASPVTVSFNGGAALTVKTNSGNDVATGGLLSGMIVMGIVSGSTFRMVSDQASAAVLAAAEAAKTIAEGAAATALAAANNQMTFNSQSALESATIDEAVIAMRTGGHTAPGDGGNADWAVVPSEPTDHDAWTQLADNRYVVISTPKLDLRQFGVFGSDNEGALVDESANITRAMIAAIALNRPLIVPATNYQFGGINFTDAFNLVIEGARGEKPVIWGTQALANAAGRMLRFNRTAYDVPAGTITLTADIVPGQKRITLSDTSQLAVGMMIEIASNQLWYYDNRGEDTCGEAHEITRIVSGTQVEIWDLTRDFYDVPGDTITVRAYWPDSLEINSLELRMLPPATAVSTCCLQTDRLFRPRVNDLTVRGATFCGWLNQRSWQGRFTGIRAHNIGSGGAIGYGVSDRASVGSQYIDLRGHSMRRLIDFEGNNGLVNRDWLVRDFEIFGGGTEYDGSVYYPIGAVPNYGVGMHGPSENGRFQDGIISEVQEGVKIRGRNIEVRNVRFLGRLDTCVDATFGTGLIVEGCSYERVDYPDKVAIADLNDSAQAQNFVKFGIDASTGPWNWGSPVSIKNNTANGLRDSFIWFAGASGTINPTNLDCEDNTVVINRPAATTFEFYKASGTVQVGRSKLGPNKVINQGLGAFDMYPSGLTIANVSALVSGPESPVEVGHGEYMFTMTDDSYAVIRDASKQSGDRVVIQISDQNGNVYGHFILLSAAATTVSLGAISASIEASAVGSTFTGTTGTDGKFSVGLTNGDLFLENRTGASRRLRLRLL